MKSAPVHHDLYSFVLYFDTPNILSSMPEFLPET